MESQFESAQREVNEHMDTRSLDIQALRQKILIRPDILFARTDDEFLVRFLRARKYDKEKAFQVHLNLSSHVILGILNPIHHWDFGTFNII